MYDMKNLTKLKKLGELAPEAFKGFMTFDDAAFRGGAIPLKYKELMAVAVANLLLDPNSGTNWHLNTNRVILVAAVFLIGLPIFYVIRAVQRARGINVDLAYTVIPPE